MSDNSLKKKNKRIKGGKYLPALCRVLGIIIILAVIAACLPVTVPQLMGYDVYNVLTGSMEPAIPAGSAVYIKKMEPRDVEDGEIIAFEHNGVFIMHRVTKNHVVEGYFNTKGDANEVEDLSDIPYSEFVGVVARHYPSLGQILVIMASTPGKICMLCLAACGALLMILGGRLEDEYKEKMRKEKEAETEAEKKASSGAEADKETSTGAENKAGTVQT